MASKAKKATIETLATDTSAAALNTAAPSNFIGSIEEAFDDAAAEGARDARGKGALLNTGLVAMKHAKVLRGTPSKKDEEFQANIFALRMRYVAGFNAVAAVESPCDVIPTEGEKAVAANKKQANKLGTFVKAGCLFDTPAEAEAYFERVKAAVAATDYSQAKTRESTFERVKSALVKMDATVAKATDAELLERVKPETKAEPKVEPATETEEAKPEVLPAGKALNEIAAALSQFVARYPQQPANATKLNAMVAEMTALAEMLHAADVAEASAEEKKDAA